MPVTPVTHPRSAIAGKVPSTNALLYGQIAVGYAADDPTLWIRDTDDQVIRVTRKIASLLQAQAGTDNETIITPWLLAQVLADFKPGNGNNRPDGGDANGDTWIDGGGAIANFLDVLDGGFA